MKELNSVLIFGATGLIGRATQDTLRSSNVQISTFSRGAKVEAPDCKSIQGDIANREHVNNAVSSVRPDVIVHLAARLQADCEVDPAAAVKTNVDGTVNILEAARKNGVRRVVFGSSVAAYGKRIDVLREDDPPSAQCSLYGETKRFGEILGCKYSDLYGLQFIALRYSGVFGPGLVHGNGMAKARAVIKSTATGRDVTLSHASGDEVCHLTYLPDAVEATIAAILCPAPRYHLYNVAGPEENHLSLRGFHAEVRHAAPGAGNVTFDGQGNSAGRLDLSRMRDDLNFYPRFTVAAGLEDEFSSVSAAMS